MRNVSGGPPGFFHPYQMVRRGGWQIALVGITLEEMPLLQPERDIAGLRFQLPAEALRDLVPLLRPQADLVVVVSHCGVTADQELARQVPGIDLIVGGHSHTLLCEPIMVGQTRVV